MGQSIDFSGLWIPLVTPLREDESLDLAALQRLVAHLAPTPIRGFVVCGSTGEVESLAHGEQLAVLDTVIEHAGGKPVMMGMSGPRAAHMTPHLRAIAERPVVALLVSPPSYLRPAQAGIVRHLQTLADASPVPLVVYDIPARTGATITLDTMLALASHPNIRAVKDCGGDDEKTRALIADGRLAILAGDDARIFGTACAGGAGAIAAAGHLLPAHYARLIDSARAGQLDEARRLHHALTPLSLALFAEPNPSVFKALLARRGLMGGTLRAPHSPASTEAVAHALARLDAAQRLRIGD